MRISRSFSTTAIATRYCSYQSHQVVKSRFLGQGRQSRQTHFWRTMPKRGAASTTAGSSGASTGGENGSRATSKVKANREIEQAEVEAKNEVPLSPPPSKRVKTKVESTVTSKAVKSFFTPASQKGPEKLTWRIVNESLLVGRYSPDGADSEVKRTDSAAEPAAKRRKIAAFDFKTFAEDVDANGPWRKDFTVIATSSGNVFGRSPSDWKWWQPCVPSKLRDLHASGYQLAVVSNQGGLSLSGKEPKAAKAKRLNDFKTKVNAVFSQLDVPISLYAATGRDIYRKPRPGMWRELLDDYDLDVPDSESGIDLEGSFFVGDAAGRLPKGKTKGDHSSSDRDFAANVGINFRTPEQFFLDDDSEVEWKRSFDPLDYVGELIQAQAAVPEVTIEKKHELEIILFVGSPGSGKSTFYRTHLEPLGFARANQDTLKTKEKCLKFARAAITEERQSVAIDNTNADEKTRADWVALAKELNVPIRCIWLQAPPELCRHNDAIRGFNSSDVWNPERRTRLPGMAFEGYKGRFKEPKAKEGFEEVIKVPFRFSGTEEMKRVWTSYWT